MCRNLWLQGLWQPQPSGRPLLGTRRVQPQTRNQSLRVRVQALQTVPHRTQHPPPSLTAARGAVKCSDIGATEGHLHLRRHWRTTLRRICPRGRGEAWNSFLLSCSTLLALQGCARRSFVFRDSTRRKALFGCVVCRHVVCDACIITRTVGVRPASVLNQPKPRLQELGLLVQTRLLEKTRPGLCIRVTREVFESVRCGCDAGVSQRDAVAVALCTRCETSKQTHQRLNRLSTHPSITEPSRISFMDACLTPSTTRPRRRSARQRLHQRCVELQVFAEENASMSLSSASRSSRTRTVTRTRCAGLKRRRDESSLTRSRAGSHGAAAEGFSTERAAAARFAAGRAAAARFAAGRAAAGGLAVTLPPLANSTCIAERVQLQRARLDGAHELCSPRAEYRQTQLQRQRLDATEYLTPAFEPRPRARTAARPPRRGRRHGRQSRRNLRPHRAGRSCPGLDRDPERRFSCGARGARARPGKKPWRSAAAIDARAELSGAAAL